MTEDTDQETESATEIATDVDEKSDDAELRVDLDAAAAHEQRIEQLQETVSEQADRIEELEALLLDLSVRAADDRGMGVCPECHGPVEKVSRWFGPTTIECRRCGTVFHEY